MINKLNEDIDFNSSEDRHVFGDIYEQILRDLQSAGNAGEYYTPRAVTQFIVDMVDPQLGETILDPACGTGGFLTCAIEHIRNHYVHTAAEEQILQQSLHGVEKKPLPHLLCTTNMLLHGLDVPTQIRHDNTLQRPLRDYGPSDRVDIIITNPPFGGVEEDGIESNFPTTFRTRETADLFLVLMNHLLKPGGRGAIVLPDGTLFGEGVKTRIKEKLLDECNVHTIVRLPNGVFNPYTGIKTNILFFTKGEPTKEIWFYEHPYPEGYKSYSKTKPIRIAEFDTEKAWWNERVENEHAWKVDFQQLKADAKARATPHWEAAEQAEKQAGSTKRERQKIESQIDELKRSLEDTLFKPKSPKTVRAQIQKDQQRCKELKAEEEHLQDAAKAERSSGDAIYATIYNLDIKNPHSPDANLGDPEELLADYQQLLADIAETRDSLKQELMAALGGKSATSETFFEHFALLADAPNGVQKLREMILQLAVRGKLVPQDPNDEPASVLLEKIKAEKERLVKEGEIKKSKLLASSNIDSTYPSLPQSWIPVPLGACVELISGQHLLPDAQNDLGEGLPYLTGPADFGERNPIATRWTTESKSIAIKNDILVTVKGAGVGKTNILGMDEATIGRQLMAIRPVWVNHEYLYLFVRSAYGQFQALSIGLTVPGIGRDHILQLSFALPPLAEQSRIVAKVDQLMTLCDKLEAKLKQSQTDSEQLMDVMVQNVLAA